MALAWPRKRKHLSNGLGLMVLGNRFTHMKLWFEVSQIFQIAVLPAKNVDFHRKFGWTWWVIRFCLQTCWVLNSFDIKQYIITEYGGSGPLRFAKPQSCKASLALHASKLQSLKAAKPLWRLTPQSLKAWTLGCFGALALGGSFRLWRFSDASKPQSLNAWMLWRFGALALGGSCALWRFLTLFRRLKAWMLGCFGACPTPQSLKASKPERLDALALWRLALLMLWCLLALWRFAALWRFGALALGALDALVPLGPLALCGSLTLWRFLALWDFAALWRFGTLRLFETCHLGKKMIL